MKASTPILVCLLALFSMIAALRAQTEIDSPIQIPLFYTPIDNQGDYKWGIALSLGGSTTPELFEVDTGGTGFYASYATNSASPWWGTNVTQLGTPASNQYDSGLTYSGNAVQTAVTFWSNSTPILYSPSNVQLGQITNIYNTNYPGISLWGAEGSTNPPLGLPVATNFTGFSAPSNSANPPIDNAFYGDFGLALAYSSNGLANIVAQMNFGAGVTPGFIVNTPLGGGYGYLQIGLTASQTNAAGVNYFAMNQDTQAVIGGVTNTFAGNTNLNYESEQLFNATMRLSNGATLYSTTLGITPDTGATPALHNTTNDPSFPSNALSAHVGADKFSLTNGTSFLLSATNSNGTTDLLNFTTVETVPENNYAASNVQVTIQNKGADSTYTNYYFNAGLYLFNEHQVTYDLQNQQIGFGALAVPEPSAAWLLLVGLGAGLLWKRKRTSFDPEGFPR
jgi:hypothetical protein